MAETLSTTQLRDEDLDLQSPERRRNLLSVLNLNFGALANALNRGITSANMPAAEQEFTIVAPSPVFTEPTLQNGWLNFGAPFANAGYRIDYWGRVYFRGLVEGGVVAANTAIFTLPTGYRPAYYHSFAVDSNNAHGRCTVQTDGKVCAEFGNNAWFFLDGITYQAASVCAAPLAYSGMGWPLVWETKLPRVVEVKARAWGEASPAGTSIGSVVPIWETRAGSVVIRDLFGLSPGRRYKVKLIAYAG